MENNETASCWEPTTSDKRIYTAEDIAAILSISRNTAYALIRSGAFHTVKIGSKYRVPKICFDKWLEGGENDGE
ncbi:MULTISPECIES: helix-turn-helix domain-containing protein [Oscillospiraceae]|jgi:excisionase family DNA binding protein|uniref:helix-turn-helix domain-containing protein n=1 Tax=Oscillospiraceae TaxID=216572 RepID=UPI00321AD524